MRQLQRITAVFGLVGLGVCGFGVSAWAQTPNTYTPPTSTTTTSLPSTTPSTAPAAPQAVAITVAVGTSGSVTVGGFAPGTTVTFTIGGVTVASGVADANGNVTVTITATDPHIAINGGTPVAVSYGVTDVSATGANSTSSGTLTDTIAVNVPAPSAAPLAFTGADIMAMVIGGLALVALGFIVLRFTRRRKAIAI